MKARKSNRNLNYEEELRESAIKILAKAGFELVQLSILFPHISQMDLEDMITIALTKDE